LSLFWDNILFTLELTKTAKTIDFIGWNFFWLFVDNDDYKRIAITGIDLDVHGIGFNAGKGGGTNLCKHRLFMARNCKNFNLISTNSADK
jgi:hypothetical protein